MLALGIPASDGRKPRLSDGIVVVWQAATGGSSADVILRAVVRPTPEKPVAHNSGQSIMGYF